VGGDVQVIARIHTNQSVVQRLIHNLLVRIGSHHPQALMYPLLVACKSQSTNRRCAAEAVVDNLRQHSNLLVEQANLVIQLLPLPFPHKSGLAAVTPPPRLPCPAWHT